MINNKYFEEVTDMSLTYHETKTQYSALRETFKLLEEQKEALNKFFGGCKPKSITFIGCGSSFYISQSFETMARVKLGIPSASLPAGDLMLHYEEYREALKDTLLVAVSRSGSTSEIVNAITNVKSIVNVPVLSVTCIENSQLEKLSDFCLVLPWAFDESVCQTRTVSNLYATVLHIIAGWAGKDKVIGDIDRAVGAGSAFLERYEEKFKAVAELAWENVVVVADGEIHGLAKEGALAFQEISQIPSNCYHLLDARHGPIVMIGADTLVIAAVTENNTACQIDFIKEIIKKGAKVIVYSDAKIAAIDGAVLQACSELQADYAVRGLPFINICQMVSYYKAIKRQVNPDKPSGLDAWIKL